MSIASPQPATAESASSPIRVQNLRCEYLKEPLGIDTTAPRLSWELTSGRRAEVQAAYQVLVATSEAKLSEGQADLWDSGKIPGNQTNHVVYRGKPLTSAQRCCWTVRVWDRDGNASPLAPPSVWEMGFLQPGDWKAKWIGTDRKIVPVIGLEGAMWISPGVESHPTTGPLYFKKIILGGNGSNALRAMVRFASGRKLNISWNGKEIGSTSGDWQKLDVYDPGKLLDPVVNVITARMDEADTTASLVAHVDGMWDFGGPFRLHSDKSWWCKSGSLSDADLVTTATDGWTPAHEICKWGEGENRPGNVPDSRVNAHPAPMFRRTFGMPAMPRSARLRVCGLGYGEVYVNGRRIQGQEHLQPAYTRYDRRVLYNTYDVTDLLNSDSNAIGVKLGTGWYDVHSLAVWDFEVAPWRNTPRVILQLDAELQDGSHFTFGTDETWLQGTGATVFDSIYEGETYDARLQQGGASESQVAEWAQPQFDDKKWKHAAVVTAPQGAMQCQNVQPITAAKTVSAVKVKQTAANTYLFDFGQNLTGIPQLMVRAPRGTEITIKCGERLSPDGRLDLTDIERFVVARDARQRFQTDVYICAGDAAGEQWAPSFTYHGFQYAEVNSPVPLTAENLKAIVLHTAVDKAGEFSCSNDLFNRIQKNTEWAYLSNLMGIPTDCPHREKNGWTGDAQLPDGSLPGIVPSSGWGYGFLNGPAWDSASVLIPWYMHTFYGDTRVLEEHYEGMRKYVDWLTARAKDGIISYGLGDWCPADTKTSNTVTSTAYYYRDAMIVSESAGLLGRKEDAHKYATLAEEIRKAFNREFFDEKTANYAAGSQAALGCALYEHLVPPQHRDRVIENLVSAIHAKNNHIDTGILGAKYVPNALLDAGRADVVNAMFNQRDFPSYGWWIEQGATTLWEEWNGDQSRNHIMFGDISAWFYKALGGIRPEGPGWRSIYIEPNIVNGLTSASAHYRSINGLVSSSWKRDDRNLEIKLQIPANTSAFLVLPATGHITEGGKPVEQSIGVSHVVRTDVLDGAQSNQPRRTFQVGSGSYVFRMPYTEELRSGGPLKP
jgi:alpha-L-rhamnosidase